ncbi:unnamed protein product, partial [Sphacelaria rigidula]
MAIIRRSLATKQEGTSGEDNLYGTTAAEDGSVVVTGRTAGDWDADSAGDFDFIAAKFDAGGNVQWRWQVSNAYISFS